MSTVERSLHPFRDVTRHVITRQKHYIVLFTITSFDWFWFYSIMPHFVNILRIGYGIYTC